MDELKQRVMDATMFNIGQLANMMGFAWSGGCWSKYAGDDMRRRGDTWESTYRSIIISFAVICKKTYYVLCANCSD